MKHLQDKDSDPSVLAWGKPSKEGEPGKPSQNRGVHFAPDMTTTELRQHPLSAAFPRMPKDEFQSLLEDITKNGQQDPITLFEGMVLDGWHRYQCSLMLGGNCSTQELPEGADPVAFVISKNIHRRSLNASQRAVAVAQCHEWAERGSRITTISKYAPGAHLKGAKELAKLADVSTRTIVQAKQVIKNGQADEVMNGHASVKSLATPPKLSQPPDIEDVEDEPDWQAELLRADKEIKRLEELVGSLSTADKDKEIATWSERYYKLNANMQQKQVTQEQAEKTAKYRGELLAKIRKALNVERDSEILGAIKNLQS